MPEPSKWRTLVDDGHAAREWIGIALGVLIAFLIGSGLSEVRDLRDAVSVSESRTMRIEEALSHHIASASQSNLTLAKILGLIEGRLRRIEQIQGCGGDGGRSQLGGDEE